MERVQIGRQSARSGLVLFFGLLALVSRNATAQPLSVPDVPFLAQTEALCGGASLAMVMRYWGDPTVEPRDFENSLNADGSGISQSALQARSSERGFKSFAFRGTPQDIVTHLHKGRPVIAMISSGTSGRFHYVVVLAWIDRKVLIHDPAVGPFRLVPEQEWMKRWEASNRWTLLVLKDDVIPEGAALSTADSTATSHPAACNDLVKPAVELALAGKADQAEAQLRAATMLCPDSSSPWRELGGIAFRAERWEDAKRFTKEAIRRDPSDELAWKILATSRFVSNDKAGALDAWNRIGGPRIDLVRVLGFERVPTTSVLDYLGLDRGELLTSARLAKTERRVEALPAVSSSRVDYEPLPNGAARVDVNVVERKSFSSPLVVLATSAANGASQRAITADVSALSRTGDLVNAKGWYQRGASLASLSVSTPRFLSLPGVFGVNVSWDRQSYRFPPSSPAGAVLDEERWRAAASLSNWWSANTRATFGIGIDHWVGRGDFVSGLAELDRRLLRDRVSLAGTVELWRSSSETFKTAAATFRARSSTSSLKPRVSFELTRRLASENAPYALWSGGGNGSERGLLLRGHDLMLDGAIEGATFGRSLFQGTIEAERPVMSIGVLHLGLAVFGDALKVTAPVESPTYFDAGIGVRIHPAGWKSSIRLDAATSTTRFRLHLSGGIVLDWP